MVHKHIEHINEFNRSSWHVVYNVMITIAGITKRQKKLLNIMWDLDTTEDMLEWFETLDDEEFQEAVTLHEMILITMTENDDHNNLNLAKQMLRNIGVEC